MTHPPPPPTPADPFEAIAPFYDLDLDGFDDDIELYAGLPAPGTPRVLELGCGTGRVAIALASRGFQVTGVDLSAGMLRLAEAKAREAGVEVEWIGGDLRTLDLGRRFDAVIAPLGTFQHLEHLDDVVRGFEVLERHLEEGGIAVVDVEAPRADDFAPGRQPVLEHWTRESQDGGALVTKTVATEAWPAEGLRDVTWHFDVQRVEGQFYRVSLRFTMRTYTAAELELAGRLAGLTMTRCFGGYGLEPYEDGAERIVAAFEHPRQWSSAASEPA